ncbi:MAG: hypothetical protein AABX38_03735 [Candidatus Micrarchaeota archaeon]
MTLIKLELSGTKRKEIVSTGVQMPWLQAHQMMQDKGGLPENKDFHRDLIIRNTPFFRLITQPGGLKWRHPIWLNTIVICPGLGSYFKRGRLSVSDPETELTIVDLDKHLAQSEFTGRAHKNTVLLISEFKEFAKEGERDIIVPKKVIVATNVARYWGLKTRDRQVGKIIDPNGDCLPRILTAEESAKIDKKDGISAIDMGMQTFTTNDKIEVRPLSRAISDHLGWRYGLNTYSHRATFVFAGYNRTIFEVERTGNENLEVRVKDAQ